MMLAGSDEVEVGGGWMLRRWGKAARIGKDLGAREFQTLTMLPPTGQNFQGGFHPYCVFLLLTMKKHTHTRS